MEAIIHVTFSSFKHSKCQQEKNNKGNKSRLLWYDKKVLKSKFSVAGS